MRWRVKAPIARPTTETHIPPSSMAGTIRLKEEAASITPTAKPSITSRSRSEIHKKNKMGMVPAPVAKPAARLAINPILIISMFKLCQPLGVAQLSVTPFITFFECMLLIPRLCPNLLYGTGQQAFSRPPMVKPSRLLKLPYNGLLGIIRVKSHGM